MNYIHQLKRAVDCRDAQLRAIDADVIEFTVFLHGPKFTGTEAGERKDWIATADVINWLREMRSRSIVAGENALASFNPHQEQI